MLLIFRRRWSRGCSYSVWLCSLYYRALRDFSCLTLCPRVSVASVILALWSPLLWKRELNCVLLVHLYALIFVLRTKSSLCRPSNMEILLITGVKYGNGSFRPESFRPRVVSPSITWVVSPSYPESFRPLFDESFRPLSEFIFYWGYCDKFTVFVSFNEDFGYISLKNDMSFINWSKWYIYLYSV